MSDAYSRALAARALGVQVDADAVHADRVGAEAALAAITDRTGTRVVADYVAREAIPLDDRPYGLTVYVQSDGSMFQWRKAGAKDTVGATLATDEWVFVYDQWQIKRLDIDPAGILAKEHVEGLPEAIDNIAATAAVEIADFKALALSTETNPNVDLSWHIKGVQPDSQSLAWDGYSLAIDGSARSLSPRDQSITTGLGTVGNSLSDSSDVANRYSQLLATALGVDLVSVARYSSDGRQVYRLGAKPLLLTVAGDTLPATGSPAAAITAINGNAPSADGAAHPESFLNTGDASVVSGMTAYGYIGDRRVSVSITNGNATDYKVAQLTAGGGAVALDGPTLFVPEASLQFVNRTVIVWLGNNYFYSGVPNTYGDYTNPQMWVDMALIVQFLQSRGNRVILLPIIPDSAWATTGTGNPYTAHLAANARTASLYPTLYAGGLLAALQAAGDGGTNDNADIAAGLVPRSLHLGGDTLHLSAAGDVAVKNYVQTFMAAQTLPPVVTQSTVFTLTAEASQGGVPFEPAKAIAKVQAGGVATALAKRTETYVQAAAPVTTAPALWFDTSNAGFVTLNIQRGA